MDWAKLGNWRENLAQEHCTLYEVPVIDVFVFCPGNTFFCSLVLLSESIGSGIRMDENGEQDLAVGDLCFAHVRSYPWWPASIVSRNEKSQRKAQKITFSVIFFGTNETADLPVKELVSVSSSSIERYVTKAALRRKYYKEAFDEMLDRRAAQDQIELPKKEPKKNCVSGLTKKEFLHSLDLHENQISPKHFFGAQHSLKEKSQVELVLPLSGSSIYNRNKEQVLPLNDSSTSQKQVMLQPDHLRTPSPPDFLLQVTNPRQERIPVPVPRNEHANPQSSTSRPDSVDQVTFSSLDLEQSQADADSDISDAMSEFEYPSPKKVMMLPEENLACSFCSKTFKTDLGLVRHCMVKHKEVDKDEGSDGILIDGFRKSSTQQSRAEEILIPKDQTGALPRKKDCQSETK